MERTHKPELEIKVGSIQASAWKNEEEEGQFHYNISLSRLYKNRQNRWQRTKTFRQNDLSALGEVVTKLQAEFEERIPRLPSYAGAIAGTIWTNDSANGKYFTGTITRFYKDEHGRRRRAFFLFLSSDKQNICGTVALWAKGSLLVHRAIVFSYGSTRDRGSRAILASRISGFPGFSSALTR